jgi:hypothetical protein
MKENETSCPSVSLSVSLWSSFGNFIGFSWKAVHKFSTHTSVANTSFVKIDLMEATLWLGAQAKVYPSFSHLLPDLGKIRYDRSAHNAVEHLQFREYWRMKSLNCIKRVDGITFPLCRAAVSYSELKESLGQVYILWHSTPFVSLRAVHCTVIPWRPQSGI